MEKNNNSKYIWMFALFANLFVPVFMLNMMILNPGYRPFENQGSMVGSLIAILISLALTLIPIWFSGLKFKLGRYIGYIVPILFISYYYYIYLEPYCSEFCNLFTMLKILCGSIFLIFYTCGHQLRKINPVYSKILFYVELGTILTFIIIVIASGGILQEYFH